MKDHFSQYGWVNFLKSVASTKVFDIQGKNSIDSVRLTPCFDILLFASEDKLYNESQMLDQEFESKT